MKITDNSVQFEIRVWRKEDGRICIVTGNSEIKSLGVDFISTVNGRDGSKRCHKNLFKKLESVLVGAGV